MPIIAAAQRPSHALSHAQFTSLATPRLGSKETSLWKVRIEPGAEPLLHSVTREEIFLVLSGRARVRCGDEEGQAAVGDAIVVPREVPFAIGAADAEPVELLCCLPVGGKARLQDGQVFTPPWAE
jgi:quercetin dioxygenase-like cupin family protein